MSVLFMLLLLCACSATLAVPTAEYYELEEAELHFERFIEEYNKNYADENEKQHRFQIFKDNLEHANRMNVKSRHAVFGITQFMDLTLEEFTKKYTGLMPLDNFSLGDCFNITEEEIPEVNAPESFDWREHNAVTRVKNQDACGSCYAFSAIGNIEGQYAIKHKKLIELSEQQIVDCDELDGGCGGGFMHKAFTSIMKQGGIESEDSYPYVHRKQQCSFDRSKVVVKLTHCNSYFLRSQEALKRLVYSVGPISIALKANAFGTYTGGVISDFLCNTGNINHGVVIVGYGTENDTGIPYWLIKNSWGTTFGEDGYIKVPRGENVSSCGLMNYFMSSAVVE